MDTLSKAIQLLDLAQIPEPNPLIFPSNILDLFLLMLLQFVDLISTRISFLVLSALIMSNFCCPDCQVTIQELENQQM